MIKTRGLLILNLVFIFIFLNVWDYIISREVLNAMVIGILVFGVTAILWFIGTIKAAAIITLISIFEFVVMAVFIIEGFQLGGVVRSLKPLFWVPYFLMAGVNSYWGLKIYSDSRRK